MPGIFERYTKWLHTQWPAGTVEKLPVSGPDGITAQPGVRIAGDLTGIPLLKFSSDTGAEAVRAILKEEEFPKAEGGRPRPQSLRASVAGGMKAEDGVLDLAIIGAGVAGISAAIEAKKAGLNFAVFEATEIFSTVVNFPKAKPIYTYPTEMKLDGGLQFSADVKETLLEEMEAQRRAAGIEVTRARIERIERTGAGLVLHKDDKTTVRSAARDCRDRAQRKFSQARRSRGRARQGLQPPLRSERICRAKFARGGRGRFRAGDGDRARDLWFARHA